MQLEASAIVVGFLLVQTICYAGSTEQGGKEREERKVDRFMPILTGTPVHPRHWFLATWTKAQQKRQRLVFVEVFWWDDGWEMLCKFGHEEERNLDMKRNGFPYSMI